MCSYVHIYIELNHVGICTYIYLSVCSVVCWVPFKPLLLYHFLLLNFKPSVSFLCSKINVTNMNQLTFSNKQETVKMVIVSLKQAILISRLCTCVCVCVCSFAYITLYRVEPCGSIASKTLNLKKFSFMNWKYHLEPKVRPVVCWVLFKPLLLYRLLFFKFKPSVSFLFSKINVSNQHVPTYFFKQTGNS